MKLHVWTKIVFVLIILIIFLNIYLKFYDERKIKLGIGHKIYETICGKYLKGEITIGEKTLLVDISDNECKRSLGLSEKTVLNEEGMFFVFENTGNYGFWMKDMNFPIDILWIDETFKVLGIEKNISPDTYPKSFGAKYIAKYVLEVPAEYSYKNNIKVGDRFLFTYK